jgi:hypothetical protein
VAFTRKKLVRHGTGTLAFCLSFSLVCDYSAYFWNLPPITLAIRGQIVDSYNIEANNTRQRKGNTMKKATRATLKSFVRKNRSNLLISVSSRFDGMQDGVRETENDGFTPALDACQSHTDHNLNVQGIWLVGGGRDWISRFETETHEGLEVTNSCGSFAVAIAK